MLKILAFLALFFIFVLGVIVFIGVIVYIIDSTQSKHAIRKNFPLFGRLRAFFERIGEFFRQYFFAMDREELPFNRAERNWAYRAAKNEDNTIAFGSTRDLRLKGTILFVNCPFPVLGEDASPGQSVVIGASCPFPYTARSLFNISGMSYGALSKPAVLALSQGAKIAGCWMNTGEGGVSPYHLESGADLVFQIGTAKYGVRDEDGALSEKKLKEVAAIEQIKMFEIKLSQGAKPGKGGILPGKKVTDDIAKIRGIPIGKDSISPNRHIEVDNIDQLLAMISQVKKITGKPVGFKCVIGAYGWIDTLLSHISKSDEDIAPDFITIDSADGGSGAAPMSLMDNMGLPIKESLPLIVDKLAQYGLQTRIKLIVSGKLITPSMVAWALCVGADFVVSARGFMFALGCIQALQCNKDTCPTGITTHNKRLQKGLNVEEKTIRVANYVKNMVYEVGVISHSCGVKEPRQLRRFHARIVVENGTSISLEDYY